MGEDTGQNDRQTDKQTDRQTDTSTDNKGRLELSGAAQTNKASTIKILTSHYAMPDDYISHKPVPYLLKRFSSRSS